jgi:hypothetical protein
MGTRIRPAPAALRGAKIKKVARLPDTLAEVFIIESLYAADEEKSRFEGRVLKYL